MATRKKAVQPNVEFDYLKANEAFQDIKNSDVWETDTTGTGSRISNSVLMADLYAIGTKPEELVDLKTRAKYITYLNKRKAKQPVIKKNT